MLIVFEYCMMKFDIFILISVSKCSPCAMEYSLKEPAEEDIRKNRSTKATR